MDRHQSQSRTIAINYPVKGHKPRIISVSRRLVERLNNNFQKTSTRVFQAKMHTVQRSLQNQRKTAPRKFNNPRLPKTTFTRLRHWKATMLYRKTKDIWYVMRFLGHKSIKNTLIYIHLETACHPNGGDDYTTRVVKAEAEICSLIEAGFEFILKKDDLTFFRKRK